MGYAKCFPSFAIFLPFCLSAQKNFRLRFSPEAETVIMFYTRLRRCFASELTTTIRISATPQIRSR